ncbi:hypothetical protein Dsin_024299 [Dipteronia sinensis]|uniref:CCHC-type domain-containing protein n=1 Tax=Dipteronia sinensis TaxID=43782 RepID=A0AAD9ZUV4_9ROSI|nr:hypothetical protein Dsin_024299 [Dipteronia sinensis]
MNADDIALMCDAISLKEKARPVCVLDTKLKDRGEKRLALCLVGKILTTKLVNRNVFVNVMNRIWRVDGGVEIEPIKGNIFAFFFKNAEDRQRVLNGGPWSFDRAIIVFEKPAGTGDVLDMKFNSVDFWVQVHNLLLLCMNEEIGMFLGKMIGKVRDIDLSMITDISGKVTTMLLRYERLFDYCFRCGRVGHILDECVHEDVILEVSSEATRKLRVWLRAASPPKQSFMGVGRMGRVVVHGWEMYKGGNDQNGGPLTASTSKNHETMTLDGNIEAEGTIGGSVGILINSPKDNLLMVAEEDVVTGLGLVKEMGI